MLEEQNNISVNKKQKELRQPEILICNNLVLKSSHMISNNYVFIHWSNAWFQKLSQTTEKATYAPSLNGPMKIVHKIDSI